jgi:hypothetical protein
MGAVLMKWPMKHHKHHSEVKFGLKCLLIRKLNEKVGGHVLMTKFDKAGKPDYPVCQPGVSNFGGF